MSDARKSLVTYHSSGNIKHQKIVPNNISIIAGQYPVWVHCLQRRQRDFIFGFEQEELRRGVVQTPRQILLPKRKIAPRFSRTIPSAIPPTHSHSTRSPPWPRRGQTGSRSAFRSAIRWQTARRSRQRLRSHWTTGSRFNAVWTQCTTSARGVWINLCC